MKSGQFLGSHFDEDRHSIHSYASSVSSFSGKGSSSRSSAKVNLVEYFVVVLSIALEVRLT